MSGLVEFLRAQYTEAREQQLRIFRSTWDFGVPCPVCGRPTETMRTYGGSFGPLASFEPCQHEIHDPAVLRQFEEPAPDPDVLADLDAKLAILGWYEVASSSPELNPDAWQIMRQVLLLLAVPFAVHPDYREEWKP